MKSGTDVSTENISKLHERGHIAIHAISSPSVISFLDKIDDRRILNNLREDGGTDTRPKDYELFTQISATVVPPSEYAVGQHIYLSGGRILIGLNLENSVIKEYSNIDAATSYTELNKHGRHTYRGRADLKFESNDSHQHRLETIDKINKNNAYAVTLPTGDEDNLFGVEPPMLERPMNEILLKITDKSMCSLSIETSELKNPQSILNLIYVQQLYKMHTGREYPIFLYNSSKEPITTDLVDTSSRRIGPNQLFQLNPEIVLRKIAEKHPVLTLPQVPRCAFISSEAYEKAMLQNTSIPFKTSDFFELVGYNPSTGVVSGMKTANQGEMTIEIDKIRKQLDGMLIPFQSTDNIVQIHKASKSEDQRYEEINQVNLSKFIRTKILGLKEADPMSPSQMEQHKGLMKAYNLQFRLNVYAQLLTQRGPINQLNLEKDLKWFKSLSDKLGKAQTNKPNEVPEKSERYSKPLLSSYQHSVANAITDMRPVDKPTSAVKPKPPEDKSGPRI